MENNKNKKSMKFQGDMLIFCDFIQVFVFTTNHHLINRYIVEKVAIPLMTHLSKMRKKLLQPDYPAETKQAHEIEMTSHRRRCDVISMSCARWGYSVNKA